jgi:hypothetical protein
MDFVNDLLEKRNIPQLALVVLFIVYLILGLKMPDPIASVIDSTLGKVFVAISVLLLFAYTNPILSVLGVLVAYQLVKNASENTGTSALEQFYPSEGKKWSPFSAKNEFPYTLEQEVVKKMASQKFNENFVKPPYAPRLEDNYDAAPVV